MYKSANADWAGTQSFGDDPVPFKIVEIFERHGFIGGGKWYHYVRAGRS